jgi:hypothetical protein
VPELLKANVRVDENATDRLIHLMSHGATNSSIFVTRLMRASTLFSIITHPSNQLFWRLEMNTTVVIRPDDLMVVQYGTFAPDRTASTARASILESATNPSASPTTRPRKWPRASVVKELSLVATIIPGKDGKLLHFGEKQLELRQNDSLPDGYADESSQEP